MEIDDCSDKYVCLLADWAEAPPEDQSATRRLMDPLQAELWEWMRSLIVPHYDPGLAKLTGDTCFDFTNECELRVMKWAKSHAYRLREKDFSDGSLTALIHTIARNYCISLYRAKAKKKFDDLDDWLEPPSEESFHDTPPELTREQNHFMLDRHPALDRQFERTREIMRAFGCALKGRMKSRQMLAAILQYCRELEGLLAFPSHWLAFHFLKLRKKHVPEELREHLRAAFPGLDYATINSRLVYLRRCFEDFLPGPSSRFHTTA